MKKQLIMGLVLLTATFAAAATFQLYEKTAKTPIVGADIVGGEDSENSWVVVKYTFTDILAFMQSNLTFTTNTDNQTADEVDDTSTTKKFTTSAEKAAWDAKEDGLVCTDGQIKKHNGTSWVCAADDNSGGITLTQTLGGGSTTEAPSEAAVDAGLDLKQNTADVIEAAVGTGLVGGIATGGANDGKYVIEIDDTVVATDAQVDEAIAVDATGFDGNLDTTDDTLQEVAQALDDLTVVAGSFAFDTYPTCKTSAHSSGLAVSGIGLAHWGGTQWYVNGADSLAACTTIYSAYITVTDADATGDELTLNGVSFDVTDSVYSPTDLPTAAENITYSGSNTVACTGDVTGSSSPWTLTGDNATVSCAITAALSGCGTTPFITQDITSHSLYLLKTATPAWLGGVWTSATPSSPICSVEFYLEENGDVDSFYYRAEIFRGGDGAIDEGTFSAASESVAGTNIPANGSPGWVKFDFATTQAGLEQYDIISITKVGTVIDGTNHVSVYYEYNGADTLQNMVWRVGADAIADDNSTAVKLYAPN